jgi:predicted nucleic acid-binding protein
LKLRASASPVADGAPNELLGLNGIGALFMREAAYERAGDFLRRGAKSALSGWLGTVKVGRTFSQPDLIIAATALHHGLTVVTRDVGDYQRARAPVFNPWVDPLPAGAS